jgi:hypothetical protein
MEIYHLWWTVLGWGRGDGGTGGRGDGGTGGRGDGGGGVEEKRYDGGENIRERERE